MRRRKLLWVNWRDMANPLAGGAEVHADEVLARLAARGWDCVLVSHAVPGLPASEERRGYRIRREGGANTFNYRVWGHARRWVREERPDVVLDDSNKIAFFLPWLLRGSGVPVVALIHHLFGTAIFQEAGWLQGLYVNLPERLVPRAYRDTLVMVGSPSSRAEMLHLGMRLVEDVGEGVDLDGYAPPAPGERRPHALLYLGRIKRYKGLEVLFQTVQRLATEFPDVTLDVAGSGDDVPRLQGIARELGIEARVRFLGRVDEARKIELYRTSAVALNSSLKEGWGLTSIEANGCGTPMVASDVPGLQDSVQDGRTGFLVPFGDASAMADAVGQLLRDPELHARMSAQALDWAKAHTWDRVAERTEECLVRVLGTA